MANYFFLGPFLFSFILMVSLSVSGCGQGLAVDQIKKAFKEDPTLLSSLIKENPGEFMAAVQEASLLANEEKAKRRKEEELKVQKESFKDPLQPLIRKDENIRGNPDAPITLVEYSDFECPYCSRAFETVEELRKKYGRNLRFIYKHLPLSFHSNALSAARYYEGVRLQSAKKAWKFHDELLLNLSKVKQGEGYFKSLAKKMGLNMRKLLKDVNSDKVRKRIDQDTEEAAKFGFRGTPGFILNGIPVKGAYPLEHFGQLIKDLKEKGKLKM